MSNSSNLALAATPSVFSSRFSSLWRVPRVRTHVVMAITDFADSFVFAAFPAGYFSIDFTSTFFL